MNQLIRHAEYLLGRRNCVVLPGLGALICATDAARFDQRRPGILLPPRRRVVFNGAITADDGLLAASYSRSLGISCSEAAEMVGRAVRNLRDAAAAEGSASFGRLGFFRTAPDGTLAFSAANSSPVNAAFASLRNVDVDRLKGAAPQPRTAEAGQTAAPSCVTEETPRIPAARVSRWRKLRNGAAGIAASLAVLVTISLFALNPIRMANEPNKASIAPIPADNAMQVAGRGEETRKTRRLTIGLPAEEGFVRLNASEIAAKENHRKAYAARQAAEQKAAADRLSKADKFCVIVASFPTMSQARAFMASKGGDLNVLEKDGKCRVYAATAPTYEAANALRNTCGVPDAWVCRR